MEHKNIRILIFEDESMNVHDIKQLLKNNGYLNVKVAKDYNMANSIIEANEPDLIFIGIQNGGALEGLDLAADCVQNNIPFIYTTSYYDDQTIEKASKFSPIAYIIKPFREEELKAAIQIYRSRKGNEKQAIIKDGLKKYRLKLNNILFIEAHTPYVKIHLVNSVITVRNSLANVIEPFGDKEILRIHRSFAVNTDKISVFKANMVEINGFEIPVSRTYAKMHRKILRKGQ